MAGQMTSFGKRYSRLLAVSHLPFTSPNILLDRKQQPNKELTTQVKQNKPEREVNIPLDR